MADVPGVIEELLQPLVPSGISAKLFPLNPPAGKVPRTAFMSEEPGQVAHDPGKKQAPGRAEAGQGGADVPTQTPPQVGGAAGRWAGS